MRRFTVLMSGAGAFLLCLSLAGCPIDGGGQIDLGARAEQVQEALTKGNDSLLAEDYDEAIAFYKDAYANDNFNPEAIIYSTLAELAAISVDPRVKNLMQNRLGITSYPATLGALFSDSWMKNYPDEQMEWDYWDDNLNTWVWWNEAGPNGPGYYYYGSVFVTAIPRYRENRVPELQVPGWFASTGAYMDSKIAGTMESYTTWTLLLGANLLDKNTGGLNDLFAGILDSVFGTTFDDLIIRSGRLKDSDSVKLDGEIIEKFGLAELFEGDVFISKAELDVLLASLRIIKASFEWLASYNWETDFSFLKYDWSDYNTFLQKLDDANVTKLPFRNSFLKNQNADMLGKSKADYAAAINTLFAAYDAIGGKDYIPEAAKDEWNNYRWIKDGLGKLRDAITNGGIFYIPENMPSGNIWPNDAGSAVAGFDMGKFFQKDYLSLNTLVELVEPNGDPKFYGITYFGNTVSETPFVLSNVNSYDYVGIKIKTAPIEDLIPVGLADLEDLLLPIPVDVGEILYQLYN
jgi:hypothetical protein